MCPSLKSPYVNFANSHSKDLKELEEGLGETGLCPKARIRKIKNSLVSKAGTSSSRGSISAALGEMTDEWRIRAVFLASPQTFVERMH